MVDERGQNPLHRLIISCIPEDAMEIHVMTFIEGEQNHNRIDLMVYRFLLRPENFQGVSHCSR